MGIVENVKEIADLVQKVGNLDLSKRIIELEREIFELTHENWELKKATKELEEQLQLKAKLTYKEPLYYAEGDEVPGCVRCWENDKKFIHVIDLKKDLKIFDCPQCKHRFRIEYHPPSPIRRRKIRSGPHSWMAS